MIRRPPRSTRTDTLFPYTTLFRSGLAARTAETGEEPHRLSARAAAGLPGIDRRRIPALLRWPAWRREKRHCRCADVREARLWPWRCRHAAGRQSVEGLSATRRYRAGDHPQRSEERLVGTACVSTCSSRWAPYH